MTDLAELLRQIKRIEIRTQRVVSSLASGAYRSAFKGSGLEFDEVREYSPGDDVRVIDWNVTARAGKPYIKVFREERELSIMLLVDTSGSMRFGAIPGVSPRAKLALAAEAAAVVAVTALRNRDRIGLVRFADTTQLHLPARKGRGHALRVVREVLSAPETRAPTSLAHALDELMLVAHRRTVCFVVSDFLLPDANASQRFARALARAGGKHDVVGLRVADPAEHDLPAGRSPLVLADPEGDGETVLANSSAARQRYRTAWADARAKVKSNFHAAGCDLVELSTASSATSALQRFFRERRRRVR